MKHITSIVLIIAIILSSFSILNNSVSSTESLGKVCVLVDHSKYEDLQTELDVYKSDLQKEGYLVEINATEFVDHIEVKKYLVEEWQNNDLVGCVIVGDIPFAWY